MKKTFKQLREIEMVVSELYKQDPKLKDTKFGYAYKRFADKNYYPTLKLFQEAIEEARIDNALEDEKTKAILRDPTDVRGYRYSKESLKQCIKAENKVIEEFNAKEIDVEPYISTYVPDLSEDYKEILKGCLIK